MLTQDNQPKNQPQASSNKGHNNAEPINQTEVIC